MREYIRTKSQGLVNYAKDVKTSVYAAGGNVLGLGAGAGLMSAASVFLLFSTPLEGIVTSLPLLPEIVIMGALTMGNFVIHFSVIAACYHEIKQTEKEDAERFKLYKKMLPDAKKLLDGRHVNFHNFGEFIEYIKRNDGPFQHDAGDSPEKEVRFRKEFSNLCERHDAAYIPKLTATAESLVKHGLPADLVRKIVNSIPEFTPYKKPLEAAIRLTQKNRLISPLRYASPLLPLQKSPPHTLYKDWRSSSTITKT